MKRHILKVSLVIGIFFLLLGAGVVSSQSFEVGNLKKNNKMVNFFDNVETFYPSGDTHISHAYPDGNDGGAFQLRVKNEFGFGPGYETSILIKFDVSSIPQGSVIESADLYLYFFDYRDTFPGGRRLDATRITNDWDEMTVTWNTQPSYALGKSSDSIVPGALGEWMDWDLTMDVQDFVDGEKDNYGWKISDEYYWGGASIPECRFYSSDIDNDYYPYLEVELAINEPPEDPFIYGPATGKSGVEYEFLFMSDDPNENDVMFSIEWGDGLTDDTDYYASGEPVNVRHTYDSDGTFIIRAKAIDSVGDESGWSVFTIVIPKNKATYNSFFLLFLERFPILGQLF